MSPRKFLWFIILLILFSAYFNIPKFPTNLNLLTPKISLPLNKEIPKLNFNLNDYLGNSPLKLGLDLQGGTQLVLQTDMSKLDEVDKDPALESARIVIERRVNLFGVSESLVQSSKLGNDRRILVELPGIKDAETASELVGKTAQLQFKEIPEKLPPEATASPQLAIYYSQPTELSGEDLVKAQVTYDTSRNSSPAVSVQFTAEGAKKFAEITKRNVGKQLPIFLDDEIVSAPVVQQEITDNVALITGQFTTEEAKNLSVQLNAGALPVPIKIIEQRSIGASLGEESINKSIIAGIIGLLTVMFYMAFYYRTLGLIANLTLIIYTIFVLAIFRTGLFMPQLQVTLTLAGIAGFILSIGMAVDANILIFERMKEEKRWGKSNKDALESGFRRAWSSIKDSNISSLITAGILYFTATGLVKGFAITLAIGVLVSMFTAIIITRTILRLLIK